MRVKWGVAAIILCGPSTGSLAATDVTPLLLVELFTSQGCSSCPPADAILAKMSERTDMVVLGWHVDYWDSQGWADPFAISAASARQRDYQSAFHKQEIYTPQMVIDGTVAIPGNNQDVVVQTLNLVRSKKAIGPVVTLTRQRSNALSIDISGATIESKGVVWLALYETSRTVEVKRGENRGRTILDVNIVREVRKVGKYSGTPCTLSINLPPAAWGQGVAVWVQPSSLGAVSAVAALHPVAAP